MNTSILKSAIAVTRPRFLLLVPACVLLGIASSVMATGGIKGFDIFLVMIGALAAHMSVNALNEYSDFKSGLDLKTTKTPFSGGTKTLPEHPQAAPAALKTGLITLLIAMVVGIYFTFSAGWQVWIPAIIGVLTIVFYTGPINRNPYLCLVAPGIGFGSCMVMGTHFALTGYYTLPAFVVSLIPFFLVSNLLLLNQFPDVDADKTVGRCHFPIKIGRPASAKIFFGFLVAAFTVIVVAVLLGILPRGALAGLFMVGLAFPMQNGVFKNADNIKELEPFMGMNVIMSLVTPTLVAIGIFLTI